MHCQNLHDDINILVMAPAPRTHAVYSGNDLHFVAPRRWQCKQVWHRFWQRPPQAGTQQCSCAIVDLLKAGISNWCKDDVKEISADIERKKHFTGKNNGTAAHKSPLNIYVSCQKRIDEEAHDCPETNRDCGNKLYFFSRLKSDILRRIRLCQLAQGFFYRSNPWLTLTHRWNLVSHVRPLGETKKKKQCNLPKVPFFKLHLYFFFISFWHLFFKRSGCGVFLHSTMENEDDKRGSAEDKVQPSGRS